MPNPAFRSKLFVPGGRPALFAKALAGPADAISFDLEDAVPEAAKDAAREAVRTFLDSDAARGTRKTLVVRVNGLDSIHCVADLAAVARDATTLINLPKPQSADDVTTFVARLEAAESANGVTHPIGILANIETPAALRRAHEIAAAHPRVVGLQVGLGDLFEPHGIDRRDEASIHAVLLAVRLAAAEAGVFAVDGAFGDLVDLQGFRGEALRAHRLGFVGKSCIHPTQVGVANDVFGVDGDELARARRIVAAEHEATARGHGAYVVDGRMIDGPYLERAKAVVAQADRGRDPA